MTSISATSSSSYQSPLQLLQAQLQSEVNSGAVSSTDQTALSSALTDINSALQGGDSSTSSSSSSSSTTSSSPGDIKSKIDSLIANEVSSGKLTADQATELQGVFSSAFANGPGGSGATDSSGATAAVGGPGGAGGPSRRSTSRRSTSRRRSSWSPWRQLFHRCLVVDLVDRQQR